MRLIPRFLLVLVLLALVLLWAPLDLQAEEGDVAARLRALASEDEEVQAPALEAWKALPKQARVELLRTALQSEDVEVATIAAGALDIRMLDLAEIHRVCALLLREPFALMSEAHRQDWGFASRNPPGREGLLPFFRRVAALPGEDWHNSQVTTMHKVLRSHHVEGLLPLLESAPPTLFRGVLWSVMQCGLYDREDVYRGTIARGLVYGLRRLRAERAGAAVPKLAEVPQDVVSAPAESLPAAFKELWGASQEGATNGFLVDGEPLPRFDSYEIPRWLGRWARILTPGVEDLLFLHALLAPYQAAEDDPRDFRGGPTPDMVQWAMKGLARWPGPEGRGQVEAWAAASDERALHAAVALDSPEGRARARALLDVGIQDDELAWLVDRARERRAQANVLLSLSPPQFPLRVGTLGPNDRPWIERDFGVAISEQDLDAIEALLWADGAGTLTLCGWHAYVRQGRISETQVDALLPRLQALAALQADQVEFEKFVPFLATLHHRRPEALRALLRRWVETQPALRDDVLILLARLGDAKALEAMFAGWSEWGERDARMLGRVRDERVAAFLLEKLDGDVYHERIRAMQALLVWQGLPAPLGDVFSVYAELPLEQEPLSGAAALLREGKGLEAVLHGVAAADGEGNEPAGPDGCLHALGLVEDERAQEALRSLQRERYRGRYWDATVGLALAGDEAARMEVMALLAEDRTWVLMDLASEMFLEFPAPLAGLWVERLDSNCCLSFEAMEKLRIQYPTIPWESGYGGAGRKITRAWLDATTWTRTPLLEGFVPVGR